VKPKVTILGAGFAGMELATQLSGEFADDMAVTPVRGASSQVPATGTRVECSRHATLECPRWVGNTPARFSKFCIFTQVRRETGKE
jgi:cation diffusion facilitator CzcD-associated flavoprotein CzcO